MRFRGCWKKGAILLQTLVMSVILSLIAVMVLKWVLARYLIVSRIQASSRNTGNAQGYAAFKLNKLTPDPTPLTIDGKPVSCSAVGDKFTITVPDEY